MDEPWFTRLPRPCGSRFAGSLLLALLVGLSRVYLGVHYPTDVLAGWSAGLAWALPCWLVARYVQHRGQVKPPA